jgi:hypothetical protein
MNDARKNVAANLIGPEPMFGAGCAQHVDDVDRIRIVRRDKVGERGEQQPASQDRNCHDHGAGQSGTGRGFR